MKKSLVFVLLLSLVVALPATAQVKFKDMADNHWAAEAVYDLVKRGITTGFPDGTFRGDENLSRYQTAVFLYKMAKSIEGNVGAGGAGGISKAEVSRMIDQAMARKGMGSGGDSGVSGVIYAGYIKGLSNSTMLNQFGINRAYVSVKRSLGNNAMGCITLDSSNMTGTFLKYAYVDLQNVLAADAIPGVTLDTRIGMQPTYWAGWVDGILDLHIVAPSLVSNWSTLGVPSADIGAAIMGTVSMSGMPSFNYVVTGMNGTGFNATENNSAKNVATRVDAELAPGVIAGLGAHLTDVGSDDIGNKLVNALIGYKGDDLGAYGELLYGTGKKMGVSVAGTYMMVPATSVFGRFDLMDPNGDISDDQTTILMAGVAYDWNANVKLLAEIDATTLGTNDPATQAVLKARVNL